MAGIELEGDNDDAANLANELLAEPPEKALMRRGSKRFSALAGKVNGLNIGGGPEKRRNSTFIDAAKSAANSR